MQSIHKATIDKRLQYIIRSLENESHSTNFGYTMEDGVRLILETNTQKVCELFKCATGWSCSSSGCIVSHFEEQMENLSLSTYYESNNNLQLLLPISDKNSWVDAIVLCKTKSCVYVVGIQITTSSLHTARINKTNVFLHWMKSQVVDTVLISASVFYICKDCTGKKESWWSFSRIHVALGKLAERGPCQAAIACNGMCNFLLFSIIK